MGEQRIPRSSLSLFRRWREAPEDRELWDNFCERYGTRIFAWCLRRVRDRGVAEELTQEVFIKIRERVGQFDENRGAPQAWVRTVVQRLALDWGRVQSRRKSRGATEVDLDSLCSEEAVQELVDVLETMERIAEAEGRARERVNETTFACYWLTCHEGLSTAEAGERLGIQANTVRMNAYRVRLMIREELGGLEPT